MSETRGYPNPNYDPQSIGTMEMPKEEVPDMLPYMVMIDTDRYEELVSKAVALSILTAHIKTTGKIDEEVVRAVTGTYAQREMVSKAKADQFWGWYVAEKETCNQLREENEKLKEMLDEAKKTEEE